MSGPRVSHAYFPAFDVFRGIGIIFVVLAHTPTRGDVLAPIRPIGALGVHMFFALSGFLITYRFLEERDQTGRIDLRAFYRRRARRILPPAVIYLAALAAMGPWRHWLPAKLEEIWASLFFYRNLAPGGWYTGHFWSLSLEEQFYLFWPVLLVASGKRARMAAIAVIVATAIWRAHVFAVDPRANIYRPDLLADHLLWGCVIGLSWKQVLRVPARFRMAAGVVGIAAATILILLPASFLAAGVCIVGGGGVHSGSGRVAGKLEGFPEAGRGELRLLYLAILIPAAAFCGHGIAVCAAAAVELFFHRADDRREFLADVPEEEEGSEVASLKTGGG